jgi:hypothetical protein
MKPARPPTRSSGSFIAHAPPSPSPSHKSRRIGSGANRVSQPVRFGRGLQTDCSLPRPRQSGQISLRPAHVIRPVPPHRTHGGDGRRTRWAKLRNRSRERSGRCGRVMVSSNLPSTKGWDGFRRRESADIPCSREQGERSAQAIPLARNESGRGRPLSLLLLLPLPALLRHVMSGKRNDYFSPHPPPRRVVFLAGGDIGSSSTRLRALLAVAPRARGSQTTLALSLRLRGTRFRYGSFELVLALVQSVGRLARAFERRSIPVAFRMRRRRIDDVTSPADGALVVRHRIPGARKTSRLKSRWTRSQFSAAPCPRADRGQAIGRARTSSSSRRVRFL